MPKSIVLDDHTHKRLTSVKDDISSAKKRDIDYDDVINFLIDTYVDSNAFSGENAGG